MTTGEPQSNRETHLATPSKRGSIGKNVLDRFWLGSLAEKRRALPKLGARAQALAQRAQSSADLAQNGAEAARSAQLARSALTPSEPIETSTAANTCELYRQSVYWSLCALAAGSDERAGTIYDAAIWATLDEQLLVAAVEEHRAPAVRTALLRGSFVYFAELPSAEQRAQTLELRKLADLLLAKVNERSSGLRAIYAQRKRLILLSALLVAAIAGVSFWVNELRHASHDLAQGKPWRASSEMSRACVSPQQACPESPNFFFHTLEEKEPSISFDLGRVESLSVVHIDNRKDCCFERSFPLVVEVSEDNHHFQTVARQDASFTSWRATFPAVKARWVRLRVQKPSYLHLARVRILR